MKLRLFRSELEAELEHVRCELALSEASADEWEARARKAEREVDVIGARLCRLQVAGLGSTQSEDQGGGDG